MSPDPVNLPQLHGISSVLPVSAYESGAHAAACGILNLHESRSWQVDQSFDSIQSPAWRLVDEPRYQDVFVVLVGPHQWLVLSTRRPQCAIERSWRLWYQKDSIVNVVVPASLQGRREESDTRKQSSTLITTVSALAVLEPDQGQQAGRASSAHISSAQQRCEQDLPVAESVRTSLRCECKDMISAARNLKVRQALYRTFVQR